MSEQKDHLSNLISVLKQQRDELALKAHLGTMESKEEWDKLSRKFDQLSDDFEPAKTAAEESAGEVWESMKLVAEELKNGFERIRKSF
jgi:chromosome segregation ATPase